MSRLVAKSYCDFFFSFESSMREKIINKKFGVDSDR